MKGKADDKQETAVEKRAVDGDDDDDEEMQIYRISKVEKYIEMQTT